MEDNELKQRFFAQYLGCRVVITNEIGKFQFCLKAVDIGIEMPCIVDDCFLILKDLSKITDEDVLIVNKERMIRSCIKENILEFSKLSMKIAISQYYYDRVDMLRSLGYLVPFLHLSIQDILDRGWAKYAQ
jgi:hypothetical protein